MIKRKLSEIATLINGYTFKSDLYKNEGIRVIRIANVQDGFISDEYPCFYPIEYVDKIGVANLKDNDLLMSLTGNVGRVAYITKNLLPAGLNQRVLCIRPINENIKDYLYYFFRNSKFKTEAEKNATGIAQLNLSTKWLSDYEIPVYDDIKLAEITSNLKKIDNLIKVEKENLHNYEELIKSRFIEMFGNTNNDKKVAMIDVCSIITDGTHQPPKFINDGIPFIFVSNIANNFLTYTTNKFISEKTYNELIKRTPIEIGDLLLSTVGSYGHPAIIKSNKPFCFQRHIAYLKPKRNLINSEYLHSAFLSEDMQKQIEEKVKGVAQKTLNLSEIKKLIIPLPPIELQNEFAEFVKLTDKLKFIAQKRIDLYTELLNKKMDEYFN